MSIDRVKQVEIFCAFVIDFQKIKNTVSHMVMSLDDQDIKRVEKMCAYIADIIQDAHSSDDVLLKIENVQAGDKVGKLLTYVIALIQKEKNQMFEKMKANYRILDHLVEAHHLQRNVEDIFNEDVITSDAAIPITADNLKFLNWIAKLGIENRKEIDEAEKVMKGIEFRDKIRQLYHENSFYFEQVFSNTDMSIQKKMLGLLNDYHNIITPSEAQIEALDSLRDIGILSDINTLAIKSKTNVSDHQAFDAFCKILKKNTNKKLLNKILRENIIMTSMFKTHSTTIGEFYGLRKLFISARYPYNKIIIQRYMQLIEKSEPEMALIFKELKKDFEFNLVYGQYVKSEETSEFKKIALGMVQDLDNDDVSNGTLESLAFIVESFIYMEKHDTDILSQQDVFHMLDQIYFYVVRNKLYLQDIHLIRALGEFRHARIQSDLTEKVSQYFIEDSSVLYGVAPGDLWYDLNKFLIEHKITHLAKIYFKYDEITYFPFEIGKPFIQRSKNRVHPDFDKLPSGEIIIICADVDKTNFELYLYGLYSRMARAIFSEQLHISVNSVTGSLFMKKVIPGLDKEAEVKMRKIVMGLITFTMLMSIDKRDLIYVYIKKVKPLLEEMLSVQILKADLEKYVHFDGLDFSKLKLDDKAGIQLLLTQLSKFNRDTKVDDIYDHATRLVKEFGFM